MSYFFVERSLLTKEAPEAEHAASGRSRHLAGPRIGLTAGRVLGKAVDRNRIKRRMREAVRLNLILLTGDVDVILHPRRTVTTVGFPGLQKEVAKIFSIIQKSVAHPGPEQQRPMAPRG